MLDLDVLREKLAGYFPELNLTRVMMTAEGLLPAYNLADDDAPRGVCQGTRAEYLRGAPDHAGQRALAERQGRRRARVDGVSLPSARGGLYRARRGAHRGRVST